MILTPLQKLPKNGEDWSKLIVAKVQKIAQSGHTVHNIDSSPTYTSYQLTVVSIFAFFWYKFVTVQTR